MRFTFGSSRLEDGENKKPGLGARIGTSLFFLFFGGMGTLFFVFIIQATFEALTPHFWDETPCVIKSSTMTSGEDYEFTVRYRYQVEGRHYTGDTYRPGYSGGENIQDVRELQTRYPVGSEHSCRVNPSDPQESTLRPGSPWIALFILLPLVFMGVGFGGLYAIWFMKKDEAGPNRATPLATASSAPGTKAKSEKVLLIIGPVFAIVGAAILIFWFIPTLAEAWDARSWPEVPCQVISSQVRSHDSDDGTTYSVDIHYRYAFGGQTHESNRYGFMGGSSSGYAGKKAVVARYPRGAEAVCYVNPEQPHRAVLNRTVGLWVLIGLLPLVFLGAGVAMMVAYFRKSSPRPETLTGPSGPAVLEPETSPVARFVGMILVALFWNGIVSVFVSQVWEEYKAGHTDWFLTLFLIPFLLVGLGMIGGAFYYGLALFNPRVRLALGHHPGALGEAFHLAWQLRGAAHRLQSMCIDLVGREVVEYSRGSGKNRRTVKKENIFFRQTWFESRDPSAFRAGQINGAFPHPAPPSLDGQTGKIVWKFEIRGTIRLWPDLKEDFKIELHPQPVATHE